MSYFECREIFRLNCSADFFICKFFYSATFRTHQMMVDCVAKGFFKLRSLSNKRVFYDQATIQQNVERVVDGCQAHTVFFLHCIVQHFSIEMSFVQINVFKNCESFGSFTVLFLFKIVSKNFFYPFE